MKKQYKAYTSKNLSHIQQLERLPKHITENIKALAYIFPFRSNNYLVDELIDWNNIPEDPIFQLSFPQEGMLDSTELREIRLLMEQPDKHHALEQKRLEIQERLNPQPAGQLELNVPREHGRIYQGMQHKYDETVLFFPKQGQTCHAYCTYCFRWAQFIGIEELQMASSETESLIDYLNRHEEVSDLLITGGDPLFMRTKLLRRYIEPLLKQKPGSLKHIRIGSKALAYWPYRFISDSDSEDLLALFREIQEAGYHLSLMAHFTHIRELSTEAVQLAIEKLRTCGVEIRCQSPLIRHINDDAEMWARMWEKQVSLGMIPYYMFIARDTGAKQYFDVSLEQALKIFSDAYRRVSGLARTVRGPSMSAKPGKILVDGISEIEGQQHFVLKMIQGRDSSWVNKIFYAKYDPTASWLHDLKPSFGEHNFFFDPDPRHTMMKSSAKEARIDAVSEIRQD